jgi:hypothetical protein
MVQAEGRYLWMQAYERTIGIRLKNWHRFDAKRTRQRDFDVFFEDNTDISRSRNPILTKVNVYSKDDADAVLTRDEFPIHIFL